MRHVRSLAEIAEGMRISALLNWAARAASDPYSNPIDVFNKLKKAVENPEAE